MFKRLVAWTLVLSIVILAVSYQSVLTWFGNYLVQIDAPVMCDAIVVSRGIDGLREEEAARQFQQGIAPRIVLTGGAAGWQATIPGIMASHIKHLGVPQDSIIIQQPTPSLYEAAQTTKELFTNNGWRDLVVVGAPMETRRLRRVFGHFFPGPFYSLRVVAYGEQKYGPSSWWQCQEGKDAVTQEWAALVWYKLRYGI